MPLATLRGLTWGHRRATGPLMPLTEAFQEGHPDIAIDWTVRPLSEFEHQGIADASKDFDLIIYDHPFGGSIVDSQCFLGIGEDCENESAAIARYRYIGSSLESYAIGGILWGLPIDGATQHGVYRKDLVEHLESPIPESWADALALGRTALAKGKSLALAVETPHAILVIAALMSNLGFPWSTDPSAPFAIDRAAFLEAFDQVRALLRFCPEAALSWNAIDVHEAMATRDEILYCPCVYGYAAYGEADMRNRLCFAPFAGLAAPYYAGSVLGGAGIGVSRHGKHPEAALAFAAFAASEQAQTQIVPFHHGQPALAKAWINTDIDQRFNGFFSGARKSAEAAWIRPRLSGYIPFQREAGRIAAQALKEGWSASDLYARVDALTPAVNPDIHPL